MSRQQPQESFLIRQAKFWPDHYDYSVSFVDVCLLLFALLWPMLRWETSAYGSFPQAAFAKPLLDYWLSFTLVLVLVVPFWFGLAFLLMRRIPMVQFMRLRLSDRYFTVVGFLLASMVFLGVVSDLTLWKPLGGSLSLLLSTFSIALLFASLGAVFASLSAVVVSLAVTRWHGGTNYFSLLSGIKATDRLADSSYFHGILSGCHRALWFAVRGSIGGLESVGLDSLFTRMEVAFTIGDSDDRKAVTGFGTRCAAIVGSEPESGGRTNRLLDAMSETNALLGQFDGQIRQNGIVIGWPPPSSLRRSLERYSTVVAVAGVIASVLAVVVSFLQLMGH